MLNIFFYRIVSSQTLHIHDPVDWSVATHSGIRIKIEKNYNIICEIAGAITGINKPTRAKNLASVLFHL